MAKNARLFNVPVRDGHGIDNFLMVAQSKKDLEFQIEQQKIFSPHQKIGPIKYVGWAPIDATPTEELDGVQFLVGTGDQACTVLPGAPGHAYLVQQCPDLVRTIDAHNDEMNFGPGY